MRKVDYYKCPVCGMKYKTLGAWGNHLDTIHPGTITEGYSYARYFYYTLTGRTHGTCVQCKGDTEWSEATQKYNRYCNNPKCKQAYVKLAKSRMIGKHGVEHMLNDPEMQKKMLAGRKISGRYTFSDGSGSIPYVASYEKEFLMMLDKFMKFSASDIIAPSPNTYYYKYQDKMHFYIPDFFIPNLNLEIEVKQNTSTHPKILAVDKVKEQLKDDVMMSNPKINYIKVVDKDYTGFFDYLIKLRESMDDNVSRQGTAPMPKFVSAMESVYGIDTDDDEEVEGYTSQDCLSNVSFMEACEEIKLHTYNRKDLSKYQKHPLTKSTYDKYAYKSRSLTDIKWNDNLDGYVYTENEDEIVIGAIVVEKEESGIVFIKKIFLASGYDNLDLYPQMAKVAVRDFRATDIRLPEQDYKKIDFFKTINFREYKKSGNIVYMSNKPDDRQAQMGKKLHPVYVYISSGNNPVAIGIKAATGDQWSHASIAFDTSLTRLYTMCPRVWNDNDSKSTVMGFNIENARKYLRQDYKGNRYALYVKFVNDATYKAMQDKMHYFVKNKDSLKYDWIGIAKMFVGMRTANSKGKYVCSNLVAAILNADRNLTNGKPTDTIKPGDLQHIEDAFLVDFGFFRNYDQVEIDKRVAEIYERNYGSKRDSTAAKEQLVLEESMIEDFELQLLPDYVTHCNPIISKEETSMNFNLVDTAALESEMFFSAIFDDKDINSVLIYDDAMESTVLKTNFNPVKVKGSMNLAEFTKIPITQEILDKYKSQSASFDHVKLENSKGFLWVDKSDKIVGFVNVTDKKGVKWIQALNLQPAYQGYGLYEQLMKVAVKDLGGTDIATPPKNDTAKEVYQKFGFRTYNNHETVHAMTIRKDAIEGHRIDNATDKVKSDAIDNGKKDEANMTELKPVFIYLSYAKKGFGKFVKLMTNAPYSHASIAFDSSLDHIYSFATRDGHTMIPIGFAEESKAQYMKLNPETTYALYVYFATPKSFDMMRAKVAEFQKNAPKYRYDVPGVVKTFFGLPNANEKRFFCSEFVALILNSGEKKVTQKSADLMKPLDLPDVKDIRLVDMGHIKDYDKSFVDKRVNQLKKEAIRQIRSDAKTTVNTVDEVKQDNKEAIKK